MGGITGSGANFQAVGVRGGSFYLTNANTELVYVAAATPTPPAGAGTHAPRDGREHAVAPG